MPAIGKPPYRRGSKTATDMSVGILNGKPSIQVNWGGRIYGTPLSLLGAGNVKDSLDVADIRATGNITFSKNSAVYNNSNRVFMVGGLVASGDENMAIGDTLTMSSMLSGGTLNTAIGMDSATNITTGDGNVALGYRSAKAITTGTSNVYIGANAGNATSGDGQLTGNLNIAIGNEAGKIGTLTGVKTVDDLTPSPSSAWEVSRAHVSQTQSDTSGSGSSLRCDITTDGSGNPTFVITKMGSGYVVDEEIVFTDPGSTSNTATLIVATLSGASNSLENVYLGYLAGANAWGDNDSIAIGRNALLGTHSSVRNIGIGYHAGNNSIKGSDNILIGYQTGDTITTGSDNICIGYDTDVSASGAESQVVISPTAATCTADYTTLIKNNKIIIDCGIDSTSATLHTGLHVDFDRTGDISSGIEISTGIDLDVTNTGSSGGTISSAGIDIDVVGDDGGTSTATGILLDVSGADTCSGIFLDNKNGGTDFKNVSSEAVLDYFTLNTIEDGETTLTTVENGGGSTAHLNMVADGNFTVDAEGDISLDAQGGNIFLKDGGSTYTPTHTSDATTKTYVDTGDSFHYHFIRVGFYNTGTTLMFFPMPGAEDMREITSATSAGERLSFLCPFDGSVETVWARSEAASGSTVINLYIGTGTTEVPSTISPTQVTVDMSVDDTSYEFDFAGGGSNTFSQGNIIMFSVDPTSAMNDVHFMIVLKFDVTT